MMSAALTLLLPPVVAAVSAVQQPQPPPSPWLTPPALAAKYSCAPYLRPNSPFAPAATVRSHTERVTRGGQQWALALGGTADMQSTLTTSASCKRITFMPSVEISIANTGSHPVINPRVISNGRRRWYNMAEIVTEATKGARDDTERMYFIWDFVRRQHYHSVPLFDQEELHDPVKYFNMYGTGFCDDAGNNFCSICWHANFTRKNYGADPQNRALHGHVQGEVYFDGAFHFMDIDEHMFYLDEENERVVSGDAVAHDHDLAKREHGWMGPMSATPSAETAVSLFGRDDGGSPSRVGGHVMNMTLRPFESIVLRWDNIGKVATDDSSDGKVEAALHAGLYGNSRLEFEPVLTSAVDLHEDDGVDTDNVLWTSRGVVRTAHGLEAAPDSTAAEARFDVMSPWVICGGNVTVTFEQALPSTGVQSCAIDINVLDGVTPLWLPVWSGACAGTVSVALDKELQVHQLPSKYRYTTRVRLPGRAGSAHTRTAAALKKIRLVTDIMAHPFSLPQLSLGENSFEFVTDDVRTDHDIVVNQVWQESAAIQPLRPPDSPISPADNRPIHQTNVTFEWPPVPGAKLYHLFVSRREDMKLPYRAQLEQITAKTSFVNPSFGVFTPGETYYWSVRVSTTEGLWGAWSRVWRFQWAGPGVPTQLAVTSNGCQHATLSWAASKRVRAAPAVRFGIFGSNETGFTPKLTAHNVLGLGMQAGNLVAMTTETSLSVAPLANVFYRVVAIDAHGTWGGASKYVALPRPCIYSCIELHAKVGQPYTAQLVPALGIGDYQFVDGSKGAPPPFDKQVHGYYEREGAKFSFAQEPEGGSWLKLAQPTSGATAGVLSGVPTTAGKVDVSIRSELTYINGYNAKGTPWDKARPPYARSCDLNFTITVS
jgi:hypothetical protein